MKSFQSGYMYHKSFEIIIQCHFSKVFFINKFYSFDGGQNLGGGIRSLNKFSFCKQDVCIIKSKEKHAQDYFYTNVGHQTNFLKKPVLAKLIIVLKTR